MSTGPLSAIEVIAKPKALSVKLEMDVTQSARLICALPGGRQQAMLSRILGSEFLKMEPEDLAIRIKSSERTTKGA